jgi:hypothetical protein
MAKSDPLAFENNCTIEIPLKEPEDPEPGCFSSRRKFRQRVWEVLGKLKYILCW